MKMKRRDFLMSAAGGAAALAALPAGAFVANGEQPLRVGLIGCGWYGKTDLFHLIQVAPVEVVGLCDVDSRMLDEAGQLVAQRQPSGARPRTFGDYRELLQETEPEIVIVGTPDHWHALPTVDACRAGADVYVQKPTSWDVLEGEAMVAAAREHGRTVQVGLQRRSTPHLHEARDRYLASGRLGKILSVEMHSYYGGPRDFPPDERAPDHIDWEMYVGPAEWREYNPGIHPRSWRNCREFSNGQTGDLCVHLLDTVRYFLDLGWPRAIAAQGGMLWRSPESRANVHDTQTALFDYGDVNLTWTQRNWGVNPHPDFPWAAFLHGENGTLKMSVWAYEFVPRGNGEREQGSWLDESEQYPEDLEHRETEVFAAPATRRHMQDFLEARRSGDKPVCDIEEGHISSACCILANLSMQLRRSLTLDPQNGRPVDDDEATELLGRPYRGDWQHPALT